MSQSIYQRLSTLSDPTRFRILRLVEQEELGVGELSRILETPQSTVSRHLKVLQGGTWVQRRRVGTANLFSLDSEALGSDGVALWSTAKKQIDPNTEPYLSDQRRLKSVMALRGVDSSEFFERHASRWDAIRRDLFGDRFMAPTLAALLAPGSVILDLGCGTGEMLVQLAPMVRRVIGVDRENAMLAVARQRTVGMESVDIREGSLEALPVEDGSADIAICMLVLHHVERTDLVLSEACRVLKPNGHLLLLDMVAHQQESLRLNWGHRHLGFSEQRLASDAQHAGLILERYQPLPTSDDVLGPALMVARFRRANVG